MCPKLRRVLDGNALGDDDQQRNASIDCLDGRIFGKSGWNKGHRDIGASLFHRFLNRGKHRQLFVAVGHGGSCLASIHSTHHVGPGSEHQRGVLAALTTGDALNDDNGV